MIDFIPLENYTSLYYNLNLGIVLLTVLHCLNLNIDAQKNLSFVQGMGIFSFIVSVVYIGLRPISGRAFGDMRTYANYYKYYTNGGEILIDKDAFFHSFMKLSSNFLSVHSFFLICALLYIFPMYRVSRVFFKQYWGYAFLLFIVSFSFWSYGTNGIRNGIATSLFLLAITFQNKKVWMYGFFTIAAMMHQTVLLPILAYIMTMFFNRPKTYLYGWLAAIPLSLALGGFWESLFAGLGFADERLGGYLLSQDTQAKTGFRFDFLIYSASAVVAGWYFIFKKGFNDAIYFRIFNTYLIANGFWILVIRANFSNRFAYLSWFMMALVIIYPFLKSTYMANKNMVLAKLILLYFSFTYFMFFIYYADN